MKQCCGRNVIVFKGTKRRPGSMLCTVCGNRFDADGSLAGRITPTSQYSAR